MATSASRRIMAVAAMSSAAIVALIVYVYASNRLSLENSIGALAARLNTEFEVQKSKFVESITDPSGVWSISSKNDLTDAVLLSVGFGKADVADLEYFKGLVVDALEPGEVFEGYTLYRGDLELGKKTICSPSPCNVYVLTRADSEISYVGMYKN